MSWNPALEPGCPDAVGVDAIETLIIPRARDLGDFEVRRALPAPKRLQADIRSLGDPEAEPVRWNDLRGPLTEIRLGTAVRYVGAAAEYEFDRYGAAQHTVFDTWVIDKDGFADTGTFEAVCPHTF